MKANKEMTKEEFEYSDALKRAINHLNYAHEYIKIAKEVGIIDVFDNLHFAELDLFDCKADIYKALKVV